ncbi:hypothetical protein [Candidatus Nesciobacter abundans]|uniref:Uncharacterized protein n=1 Tax=Candidatus Nesciobacter abundans TaxID=2601668 RepID=A0A5C0UGP1_9PROT|nr:hypothetical protein [Candidatus Nesciobacter abundans]QEK38979.1 hypothetical protein FZC36_00825 [Candidatus Nesciobacter abundans]
MILNFTFLKFTFLFLVYIIPVLNLYRAFYAIKILENPSYKKNKILLITIKDYFKNSDVTDSRFKSLKCDLDHFFQYEPSLIMLFSFPMILNYFYKEYFSNTLVIVSEIFFFCILITILLCRRNFFARVFNYIKRNLSDTKSHESLSLSIDKKISDALKGKNLNFNSLINKLDVLELKNLEIILEKVQKIDQLASSLEKMNEENMALKNELKEAVEHNMQILQSLDYNKDLMIKIGEGFIDLKKKIDSKDHA